MKEPFDIDCVLNWHEVKVCVCSNKQWAVWHGNEGSKHITCSLRKYRQSDAFYLIQKKKKKNLKF